MSAKDKTLTLPEHEVMDLIKKDFDEKNYNAAEYKILKWLEANPNNPHCWSYLGYLYSNTKRYLASHTAHKRSVQMQPNNHMFLYNYANSHTPIGKAKEGVQYMRKAHEIAPDHHLYYQNLSYILRDSCQYEKAIEIQREIVKRDPNNKTKQFDLGFLLLHARQLDEGWTLYNSREVLDTRQAWRANTQAEYTGQDLTGKSLLIVGEQGCGDTILMLRFIKQLTDQADKVTLISRKPLFPLLEQLNVELVDQDTIDIHYDTSAYDYGVLMMSLPYIFEKDWLKWPTAPKFKPPEPSRLKIAQYFKPRPQKLNVGIVWSGSVTFTNNHLRCAAYERFMKLACDAINIQFYSLQKGPLEKDMLTNGLGTIYPLGGLLDNFGDTAAALEHIDLLVMTDSGLAHLAGSQDVPVLNLLNFLHYWLYYPRETTTTPLYPTWRMLRQKEEGDWDTVFAKTSEILCALSEQANASPTRLTSDQILATMDEYL